MFIVLLTVAAAGFGISFLAEAAKKKGGGKGKADTVDCKADKDCVAVTDECCSCNQGGKQRAIPKKQLEAYEKDRKKKCTEAACTEMMSTDPTCTQQPFCAAGICELTDPPSEGAPSDSKDSKKGAEPPAF
jgi:hypothetical protein